MDTPLIAKQSIVINTSPATVWAALTNPIMIKQFLFDTDVITDWKVGSPIIYRGVWQGKAYEDKGVILNVVPQQLLETTFWSSLAGSPDLPENYKKVTYALMPDAHGGSTTLTITQDNNVSEAEKIHSEANWKVVLENLKKLLEK